MRIDQPPEPGDEVIRDGDAVPDEPVLEQRAPEASDTSPTEPRTRFEHAEIPPPSEEPQEPKDVAAEHSDQYEHPPDGHDSSRSLEREDDSHSDLEDSREQARPPDDREPPTEAEQPDEAEPPADIEALDEDPDEDADIEEDSPWTPDEEPSTPSSDSTPPGDRARPLTDKEWTEHLAEVRDGLDKARAAGLISARMHTINGTGEVWTDERERLHNEIIEDFYARAADIPCDFKAIIAGGLGGAGKTTVLREHADIDLSQYLMINPDDVKEAIACRGAIPHIDGLSPMEASDLVHIESSQIAKRLARRAVADGKNLIWDITMSSTESVAERISALRGADYRSVDGVFVDIPIETSMRRADGRHREGHEEYRAGRGMGGRFVPEEVIKDQFDQQWGSQNRRTYEIVKERFDNWSIYDNSVDDRPPVLKESSRHDKSAASSLAENSNDKQSL